MRLRIRITDKIALKENILNNDFYLEISGDTVKDAIIQMRDLLLGTKDKALELNTLFDSFLIILNGQKVISKDEYETFRLNEGDTIIIAPLVAGG